MTQTKITCTPAGALTLCPPVGALTSVKNAEPKEKATVDRTGILLWAWGDVYHPKMPSGKYTVNEDFAAKMLHAYEELSQYGQYRPGILVEHEGEGQVYGLIINLYTTDRGIECDIRFPKHINDMIERGSLLYISPTFYLKMKHPHTGEELEYVLAEASFVSKPHLKNIPPLSEVYAHSETGFVTQTKQEPTMAEQTNAAAGVNNAEETENMEEEVEQMEGEGDDKYADLNAKIDQILALLQPPEVEQKEEGEEVEQSLAEQVQELKQSIALKDAALVVRTALPDADEATVEQLAQLKVTNSELADATIAIHQSAKPGAPVVQAPIGQGGGGNTITVEQAEAMAEDAGCMTMSSKLEWIEKHQPQLKKKFLEA